MRSVAASFLLLTILLVGCDTPLTYEYSDIIKKVEYYEIVRREADDGYRKVKITFQNGATLSAFIAESYLKNISLKEGEWYKIVCEDADYQFFDRESYGRKTIISVSSKRASE